MKLAWNQVKSERLKRIRGISFEEIVTSELIAVTKHPSRDNQRILVYRHKGYLWAVPYVIDEGVIFLKTIYPSRKLVKWFKERSYHEKD